MKHFSEIMSRGSQITDRLLGTILRGVFGLVSVLIGVSGDIISALLFPGYDMSKNMISELPISIKKCIYLIINS